jgi:hypothetical protein
MKMKNNHTQNCQGSGCWLQRFVRRLLHECRTAASSPTVFEIRIFFLKFGNLRIRYLQFMIQFKLMLLYLLDKDLCLSTLRDLDESNKQFLDDFKNFKSSHFRDGVVPPNVHELSQTRHSDAAV